jgi:hypothetical protein
MSKVYGLLAVGLAMATSVGCASAQSQYGTAWEGDGIDHLHDALYDVYGLPVEYAPGYIDPDELPVVYLLAREAGVSPDVVIALRQQGWSWLDITHHLRVDPYVYVRHLPYSSGYWGWQRGRPYRYLTDRHIIDYVNLFFWATYHRRPVTQIIVIRQRVPTWRYYVVYHAPRIVYRSYTPRYVPYSTRRWETDRNAPPQGDRRAQPRDATPRTPPPAHLTRPPAGREGQTPARVVERRDLPTGEARQPATRTPERANLPTPTRAAPQSRAVPQERPVQATPPSRPAQATRPTPQATRPTQQATRPTPQATRPTPQATRPTPQATRPTPQATRPTPQATRPTPQATRPTPRATRPTPQATRPAQAARPNRPAAQSSRPAAQSSGPAAQRPSGTSAREAASSRARRGGDGS